MKYKIVYMSQEERAARRRDMAVAVRNGQPIGAVAVHYGVSIRTVRNSLSGGRRKTRR